MQILFFGFKGKSKQPQNARSSNFVGSVCFGVVHFDINIDSILEPHPVAFWNFPLIKLR